MMQLARITMIASDILILTLIGLFCWTPMGSPMTRPVDGRLHDGPISGREFLSWAMSRRNMMKRLHEAKDPDDMEFWGHRQRDTETTTTETPTTTDSSESSTSEDSETDSDYAESRIVQVVVTSSSRMTGPSTTPRSTLYQSFYNVEPTFKMNMTEPKQVRYTKHPSGGVSFSSSSVAEPKRRHSDEESSPSFFNEDSILGDRVLGSDYGPLFFPEATKKQATPVSRSYGYPWTQPVLRNHHQAENRHQEVSYEQPEQNYEEPEQNYESPERNYEEPERNYEAPEWLNVRTNGRVHTLFNGTDDANKFGYVLEGRDYRKYRVEERTPEGYIVGEYGVLHQDDGFLRGVRYTADGTTNPKVIYEALMKFLSL